MDDLRVLATGLRFPEGPLARSDGSILLTEIRGGTVLNLTPDGAVSVVAETGGGPNGIALGPDGALYVCNNGGNAYAAGFMSTGPAPGWKGGYIQRVDLGSGKVETIYDACGGERLSSPNDLVFDRHGGFYFSDFGKRHARHRENGGLYYALADGSKIVEVAYPVQAPNGVGLSPDGTVLYAAETETSRLWAFDLDAPGVARKHPFPSPHGGRLVCGLPGYQRFDSMAVEADGTVCIGTLITGHVTVVPPDGSAPSQVKFPDVYPTNLCFGGPDMRTAFVTLAETGMLVALPWPRPGLRLNHAT